MLTLIGSIILTYLALKKGWGATPFMALTTYLLTIFFLTGINAMNIGFAILLDALLLFTLAGMAYTQNPDKKQQNVQE